MPLDEKLLERVRKAVASESSVTERPMEGFVYVDPKGCNTQRRLNKWVDRGVAFARSLPTKKTAKNAAAKRTRRSKK